MRHLSEGTLRRIYDEPLAMAAADQAHYEGCAACKARFETVANLSRSTAALLALPAFEVEARPALARLNSRIREEESRRPVRWHERFLSGMPGLRPLAAPVLVVVLAVGLLAGFSATGVLPSLIKVFEPHSFAPVWYRRAVCLPALPSSTSARPAGSRRRPKLSRLPMRQLRPRYPGSRYCCRRRCPRVSRAR